MNLLGSSPWPQWRSHWHVLHAWPPLAQWLVLMLLSVCVTLAATMWGSSEAWQAWWEGQEEWDQLAQDLQDHEQQVQALRLRIKTLRDMPHPSGWDVPAWQAWPLPAPSHENQSLRQWLAWGREHGLTSQALPLTHANAVRWTGTLAAQLAAWHGAPQAFPRMRVTSFEWQRVAGKPTLQLVLSWAQASDKPNNDKAFKPKTTNDKTPLIWPPLSAVDMVTQPKLQAHSLYNLFHVSALSSGLPPQLLAQQSHGWPQLQYQELSKLRWVGTLERPDERQALLAFNGLVYPVHQGDSLGQDWGQVVQIARDHVVLREWHADTEGQWQTMVRRLPLTVENK